MSKPQHMNARSANIQNGVVTYPDAISDREQYNRENNFSKADGSRFQKYYVEVRPYYTNAKVSSNCNSITFLCVGSQPVNVDGVVLQQGQQLKIEGNRGEIDTTEYIISFPTPQNVNNNLAVIKKMYK